MATKVYQYRLRAPSRDSAPGVDHQLRLAQKYQHLLTTIERARRAAYVRERRQLIGDLEEAENVLATAKSWLAFGRAYVSRQHSERRSKRNTAEERSAIAQLRTAVRPWAARVKSIKAEARNNAELRAFNAQLQDRSHTLLIAARAAFGPRGQGLHWGTYQLIEQACDAARKSHADPAYRKRVSHGYTSRDNPHVDGQLSVQLTDGGIPSGAVTAGFNSSVRVTDLPIEQWPNKRRAQRCPWMRLDLRIGSDGRRQPIWASWRIKWHRPLPADAIVKRATVTAKRRGLRTHWTAEFTLQLPDPPATDNPLTIAIHLGWRTRQGGLRIAYTADDVTSEREVLLDPKVTYLISRERELRSIVDRLRDLTIAHLVAWIKTSPTVPRWFAETTQSVHAWRSNHRIVRLAERWQRDRFAGDERIFRVLWHFRERWRHLSGWADGCRRRASAIRREQYRVFAAQICKQYGTILLDDTDHSEIAQRKPTEQAANDLFDAARRNRTLVSPGDLRRTIEQAARSRGVQIRRVSASNLTATCHACGATCTWDRAKHIRHTCEHCGQSWDQDENATRNMLARHRAGESWNPTRPQKASRFRRATQ